MVHKNSMKTLFTENKYDINVKKFNDKVLKDIHLLLSAQATLLIDENMKNSRIRHQMKGIES